MLNLLKAINKALDRELKKLGMRVPSMTRKQMAKLKKELRTRRML